ncbi:MAG TPA: hypothetical protein VFH07_09370 [Chitinophagaceae bacterium]|nr:hypothetical protein [Chitinophagaceae bacterium]
MNIIAIKRIPGLDSYELKENDDTVLEIRYKPDMHTARVVTHAERRVLIIENEGLLRIKMAIKNEYGIRIGSLSYDNFSDTHGSVEIEKTRYRFRIQHTPAPELHIYKGRRDLIYSCQLSFDDNHLKEAKSQSASFIIAVSWYLFLKEGVKTTPAFTTTAIL